MAYTSRAAIDYLSSRDKEVKEVREYFKATSLEDVMSRLEKILLRYLKRIKKKQTEIYLDLIL